MKTHTSAQKYNNRLHAIFVRAAEQEKQDKALPLEYAAGSIGNEKRGVVAMMRRGAWGYDDETGRIMAAAPELLAALRELLENRLCTDIEPPHIVRARAAIARATGGSEGGAK